VVDPKFLELLKPHRAEGAKKDVPQKESAPKEVPLKETPGLIFR